MARCPCPLCLASGHEVLVTAEYELADVGLIVADLSGCPHAAAFGHADRLSPTDERDLIAAALAASRPGASRRPKAAKRRPPVGHDIDLQHDA